MATPKALRLRDPNQPQGLRPAAGTADEFNSALRSDFAFLDVPTHPRETYLHAEATGYDGATMTFDPLQVFIQNISTDAFGKPRQLSVVRSPAGVPITVLDGYSIASFDYTNLLFTGITKFQSTANVATISTGYPHDFLVGMTVTVVGVVNPLFNGTFVVTATSPGSFSYALVGPDFTPAVVNIFGGYAYRPGQSLTLGFGQKALVHDSGLAPGNFYYYALFGKFVWSSGTLTDWKMLASSEVLVPRDHGYADKFWAVIPEYYRRLDTEQVGSYTRDGVLRRFITALGYENDIQRTWIDSISEVWDVSNMNARMLPLFGENVLGLQKEGALGDKRYRTLLANIMYLRKLSGTQTGIEGYLTALTGYKTAVFVGKNMFASNNDTEMRNTGGNWVLRGGVGSGGSCTLVRSTGGGEPSPGPTLGTQHFHTITNPTGATIAYVPYMANSPNWATDPITDMRYAVPVITGHQYQMSVMVTQSAVNNIRPYVNWFDGTGTQVNTFVGALSGTTTGWTQVNSGWFTAPAGAVFAQIQWEIYDLPAGGTIKLWQHMFVDRAWTPLGVPSSAGVDPTSVYETARMVYVNIYPQRANFAINANVTNGLGAGQGWTTSDPATYEMIPLAYASYADLAPKTVTNKALTTNVATITTATPHRLIVNNYGNVTVSGVGAPFDGTFMVVSVPNATTFTYALISANIASAASGGTVVGPEINYIDLASEIDPLSTSTTLTFDNINNAVTAHTETGATPFLSQVSSVFFPVIFQQPYSARLEMNAHPATSPAAINTQSSVLLRFRWYTKASIVFEIPNSSTVTPLQLLDWDTWDVVKIINASPPPGALFGRLVIEVRGPVTHREDMRKFIIEDAPEPGTWFDGNTTDGRLHDYSFVGAVNSSTSVYHQNFDTAIGGAAPRVQGMVASLIPPERDYAVFTVKNGIYS